jgi:predicted nucleic acid-binding protein
LNLFLDSSVLIPVFLADHPHHAPSLRLYAQCNSEIASVAAHSLAEVYSTLTRLPLPHRATPDQAVEFLESMRTRFRFVTLASEEYLASIRVAAANRISGGTIYDALIATCALQAGADQIFTWNVRHYQLLGAEVLKRIKTPVLGS